MLTGDFEAFDLPKGMGLQMENWSDVMKIEERKGKRTKVGKESRVLTKPTSEGSASSMWEVQVWCWGDPAGELFQLVNDRRQCAHVPFA